MKNDSRPLVRNEKILTQEIWTAEIESDHVRYFKTSDTAIEFRNEIDVWNKMEVLFRRQIKSLRSSTGSVIEESGSKDLKTFFYSVRCLLD
jgi:hypothetical protein